MIDWKCGPVEERKESDSSLILGFKVWVVEYRQQEGKADGGAGGSGEGIWNKDSDFCFGNFICKLFV